MVILSLGLLTWLGACSEASKGDGDVDPDEACSYVAGGPTLAETELGAWPEGMAEAWDAFGGIGLQEPIVLSCDDASELEFEVTGVGLGTSTEFRFWELTGPEGCEGLGPASGPMTLDIAVDEVPEVLATNVVLNRHDYGNPLPIEVASEAGEWEQQWAFSFDQTGALVDVFTSWPGVRSCSE